MLRDVSSLMGKMLANVERRQVHFASSHRLHRSRILNLSDVRARPGTGPFAPWFLVGCDVGGGCAVTFCCSTATCQSFGNCRRAHVTIFSKLTRFCCSAPKEMMWRRWIVAVAVSARTLTCRRLSSDLHRGRVRGSSRKDVVCTALMASMPVSEWWMWKEHWCERELR
jgi:hypothetical protein